MIWWHKNQEYHTNFKFVPMILKIHPKKNRTNIFAAQPFMLLLSGINSNPKNNRVAE